MAKASAFATFYEVDYGYYANEDTIVSPTE